MPNVRDWQSMIDMSTRLLVERTGEGLEAWKRRVQELNPPDEAALRAWLTRQGVTGYAQSLLVWERFGYPDFMQASAEDLIAGQYADRPQLRAILDAILVAAAGLGEITIQARKTYVSLVSPRRTFARVQPTTHGSVAVALRIDGLEPGGRLQPSKIHASMRLQIELASPDELDSEALSWLQKAYEQNK